MWSFLTLNRDLYEYGVFTVNDESSEVEMHHHEFYVAADFESLTAFDIMDLKRERWTKNIPTILTDEELQSMKRDGISVKQPLFWDFLSNPKKRIFLQYLQRINYDLKEEKPSKLIVFYTVNSRQQLSTIQNIFLSVGYEQVFVVPEYWLFIPITNIPRLFDGYLAVFDVFDSSFNIHIFHNLTPCFTKRAYNISIENPINSRMISAIDKKACSSGLPPMSNMEIEQVIPHIVDDFLYALCDNHILEFHWMVNEEERSVEFPPDVCESMLIDILSDIIFSTSKSFGIAHTQIKRYMISGHSLFSDCFRSSMFTVLKGAVPAEWYLGMDLQTTIVDIIKNPQAYDPNRGNQLPDLKTRTLASVSVSPGLHWKRVQELLGNTALVTRHRKSYDSMCISGVNLNGLDMKITYNHYSEDQIPEDTEIMYKFVPKCYWHLNEEREETVVTIGDCRDNHTNGTYLKQYVNCSVQWEEHRKKDSSYGYGKALLNNQLVWQGIYQKDGIEGVGKCWNTNREMYIGSFKNAAYDGLGCIMNENEEIANGLFAGGDWNGSRSKENRKIWCGGIVKHGCWHDRVVRVSKDGSVLMCIFSKGILDGQILWINKNGEICDSLLIDQLILEKKYSKKGVEENFVTKPLQRYLQDCIPPEDHLKTLFEIEKLEEEVTEEEESDDDAWIRCVDQMNVVSISDEMIQKTFHEQYSDTINYETEENRVEDPSENAYEIKPDTSLRFHENWHFEFEFPESEKTGTGSGCLLTEEEQIVYIGNFKEWQLSGKGVLFYINGRKQYEGTFDGNVLDGEGIWYFPNGCIKYSGMWEHGELSGPGSLYRLVDLQYCNSIYRRFVLMKGNYAKYLSFAEDFNPTVYSDQCPH